MMPKKGRTLKDQTGRRFGRLTAIQLIAVDPSIANNHKWLFKCDCGNEKIIAVHNVRTGGTQSCGCLHVEKLIARNLRHGQSGTKTHRSWKDMRARCNNHGHKDYKDYGGRGITVCERWGDFSAFLADMGERPEGCTIDRVDVNGNYEPANCRWASADEQANNKRNNRVIEYNGERKTLQQWCRQFGLEHSKVGYRLKQGWPLERAFSAEDFRK